jgi:hypothetical protein
MEGFKRFQLKKNGVLSLKKLLKIMLWIVMLKEKCLCNKEIYQRLLKKRITLIVFMELGVKSCIHHQNT